MKQYKIRVNNEAESREAQELFFELGYAWHVEKNKVSYSNNPYLFADSDGDLTYSSALSTFNESEFGEITLPQLRELAKPQGELISGAEAKLAWAKGENVQFRDEFDKWYQDWTDLEGKKNGFWITDFDLPNHQFRLKPRTVKLEIEVPAPFEPKVGEVFYVLSPTSVGGYAKAHITDQKRMDAYAKLGAWRTEEEIKIVVEQLRKLKELGK